MCRIGGIILFYLFKYLFEFFVKDVEEYWFYCYWFFNINIKFF